MVSVMPATKAIFLLFSIPCTLLAAGEVAAPAGPALPADPRPMLLYYVALAVPSLIAVLVGILSIVEFFTRRAEAGKARALGGYVTHPQLLAELAKIYDTVKEAVGSAVRDVKAETAELKADMKAAERNVQTNSADIATIEGRIEGLPALRKPRTYHPT